MFRYRRSRVRRRRSPIFCGRPCPWSTPNRTIAWFAIQEGPSAFAIFDTFNDEAGREAHLNGKVAAALMEKAKAGDLFAKAPVIHKLDIIADKLPK
jgi:hypothetical protein